jgi:hypothetical protein
MLERILVAMMRSHASSLMPSVGPKYGFTAALPTRISMPPQCATVLSTRFCNWSFCPTWQGMTMASPPLARMPAATSSHGSALRDETTTLAPCSAMRSAMARPIPLEEPVITATWPERSNKDDMEAPH